MCVNIECFCATLSVYRQTKPKVNISDNMVNGLSIEKQVNFNQFYNTPTCVLVRRIG